MDIMCKTVLKPIYKYQVIQNSPKRKMNLNKQIDISIVVESKFENMPLEEISSVPNCCGVYVITDKSGKKYVGSSKTVRTRVQSHNVHNDPNIEEDIDTVTFYLTKKLSDARTLEQWFIGRLNPELNRENQPDASKWTIAPKETLLSPANKNTEEMFEKLSGLILSLPNAKEIVRKGWITYQISKMKNFCAIKVKKGYLQIDFKVTDCTKFEDAENLSFKIASTQSWTFDRRIELYNTEQIDRAFGLIKQAYEIIN